MQNHQTSKNALLFGLGIVTGWVVKQLFDSPEVTRKRAEMMDNFDQLRQQLADSDEAQRIKEIFGQVTDEAITTYHQAKDQLIEELSILRESVEVVDKQKYLAIVNGIIDDLRADSRLSDKQLTNLSQALTDDFAKVKDRRNRLKRRVQTAADETK